MAGLNFDFNLNSDIHLGKGKMRGNMPVKRSINLVPQKEGMFGKKGTFRMIILLSLLGVLLFVYLVVRPVSQLTEANARVASLTNQLAEANQQIAEMGDIETEYAHYTTEGMTSEELKRADRVKVMKTVENAVLTSGAIKGWNLSGNVMTLQVSGASLAELNSIANALEQQPLVERCIINTANRGTGSSTSGVVAVSFVIYLYDADQAAEAEAEAGTSSDSSSTDAAATDSDTADSADAADSSDSAE